MGSRENPMTSIQFATSYSGPTVRELEPLQGGAEGELGGIRRYGEGVAGLGPIPYVYTHTIYIYIYRHVYIYIYT